MSQSKDMCCLCLNVLNSSFINLFSKSKDSFESLTHFDKISSSLSQLATVLNTLGCSDYKVCEKCCEAIQMIYKFNQTCLHNVRIFSIQNEFFKSKEQYNDLEQAGSSSKESNILEKIEIKKEIDDVSNLNNITQIDYEIDETQYNQHDFLQKFLEIQHINLKDADSDVNEEKILDPLDEEQEFICIACDKIFNSKYILKQHMQVHTSVEPFVCETCGKLFKTLDNLNNHIKFVHIGEKSHVCEICGKAFTRKIVLQNHKFIHGGEKPLSCDFCDKRFIHNGDLIKHRRIHTGEKPYKCELCTHAFTNVSNLIKHRRIHTGVRPSSLIRHKKNHLEEKP